MTTEEDIMAKLADRPDTQSREVLRELHENHPDSTALAPNDRNRLAELIQQADLHPGVYLPAEPVASDKIGALAPANLAPSIIAPKKEPGTAWDMDFYTKMSDRNS